MNSEALTTGLNEPQKKGVLHTEGPLLVIAGAGSGKTKMLTARICNLILNRGVAPQNILAVTFTNKAAGEMRERVAKALGQSPESLTPPPFFASSYGWSQPQIGTFHSICVRILRREIDRLAFTGQFVIYDDSDQLQLVKQCFETIGLSDKSFSPKSFQYSINQAKCQAQEPKDVPVSDFNLYAKNFIKVYELYQKELVRNNALDFGEIITMTYRLMRDNPDILKKYQDTFKYIHVDEYQDTNRAQYLLVTLLAAGHRNLCVVGDEDQSIYKWRGADIRNILDFEKDYAEAEVIKLEQNYRSTQTIISASSRVISNNSERKAKTLWTDNSVGEPIIWAQLSDDRAESEFVVKNIKATCSEHGYAFSDVAIFYRTNAQSRVLEDILRREKIPYKIVGGLRFYDRKEIKDVIAYFRVFANPVDSISMKRIINVPARSIGAATISKVEEIGIGLALTFNEALKAATESDALGNGPRRKLADFVELMKDLRGRMEKLSLSEFYHELLDRTRYLEELRIEGSEESAARIQNLQEFDSILVEFEEDAMEILNSQGALERKPTAADFIGPFLESVTLASEEKEVQGGAVSMMTLHTSKGLEFPVVFMVGLEEGLFPSIRAGEEEEEESIEEERRLCYVGMTRAKERLYMTNAVSRRVYGNIVYHEVARFFEEIPKELLTHQDHSRFRMPAAENSYSYSKSESGSSHYFSDVPASTASMGEFPRGSRVRHATYGDGTVLNVEGSGDMSKVTVEFRGAGIKKFVKKFAGLERYA